MVKELVVYPDDRIMMCGDVRGFDESVPRLIHDMIETMQAHGLQALSAIQVAHPFNIIVMKHDNDYRAYINPRILEQKNRTLHEESTGYLPGITYRVPRYTYLKVVYEDEHGQTHTAVFDDPETAATFQRKMDYLGGATPLFRLPKDEREAVIKALENDGRYQYQEVCPAFSKKDYFVSLTDKILLLMMLSLLAPLFHFQNETMRHIWLFDTIALPLVVVLMIGFFIYAFYESKRYRQCSSCQVGNHIGVMLKRIAAAIVLFAGAYFLIGQLL